MKNDFRETGILHVRCKSAEDRRSLLNKARALGIPTEETEREDAVFDPGDTNLYEINIRNWTMRYIGEAFAGGAMAAGGIRFYSVREFCRLAELRFKVMPRFPLWHLPHDGWKYPAKLLSSVCIPRQRFDAYHEKMRESGVGRLIPAAYNSQSAVERFEISRLLCDVERLAGPEEVMEQYGMGYCYEKAYDGTVIKEMSAELKARTLRYYDEHHRRVNEKCKSHPQVLFFDLHSYADELVPEDFLDGDRPLPEVCIGTDPRMTPVSLIVSVKTRLEEAGFTTAVDYPYTGCYIPESAAEGKSDCLPIMLQFNKRIYLDERGRVDEEKAERIRTALEKVVTDCVGLGERSGAVRQRLFAMNGAPAYEGLGSRRFPMGEGKAYFADGTVYQEGLFDGMGLLCGREYYPSGALRFEGLYAHQKCCGPNCPQWGSFYEEDRSLRYTGPIQVETGSPHCPVVTVPERFGPVCQPEAPRLIDLHQQVVWETLT